MSFIAAEWNALSEKQRKPFDEMNSKDQKRFDKENNHLIKEGWFINEDGVNSSDIEKKIKKEKKKAADEEEEKPAKEKIEKIKRKKDWINRLHINYN